MNKLIKIFPITNDFNKLQYDNEGLYSITHSNDANKISELILSNFNINNLNIVDCTAGIGGNTFSFSKYFKNVTSIEINKNRFEILKNNILIYKLKNIKLLNNNCIDYIKNNKNYNVYFFDPPWGGINYKKNNTLILTLNDYTLVDILKLLKTNNNSIIFKLPYNYNLDEFSKYNYKLYKINNYFIIMF